MITGNSLSVYNAAMGFSQQFRISRVTSISISIGGSSQSNSLAILHPFKLSPFVPLIRSIIFLRPATSLRARSSTSRSGMARGVYHAVISPLPNYVRGILRRLRAGVLTGRHAPYSSFSPPRPRYSSASTPTSKPPLPPLLPSLLPPLLPRPPRTTRRHLSTP
jgi:hypothetical protein